MCAYAQEKNCRIIGSVLSVSAQAVRPWTESEQGGKGVCALRNRALHLLRYCAALAWPGPQATAPEGAGPGV